MRSGHVAIIGASLAGLRAAEGLRAAGFEGQITLVGAERHPPYTRPPLSKQVLSGAWEPERVALRPPDRLAGLEVDLRLGVRATGLDTARREVLLDGGSLPYDEVVLATGAVPRTLPGSELDGVHVLRTLEDSLAIRDAMDHRPRMVVVGAGFIGAEVAAVGRERGLDVTVVDPLPVPMVRGLGRHLGAVAAELLVDHGVDLRCGVGVVDLVGTDRVEGVVLADGATVAADLVVVGIGVVPATGWLEGSGVRVADGVVCDATLAAEGVEHVWAVGDLARWFHAGYGEHVRWEHWTVAADHGQAVGANIVAGREAAEPHAPVPYVWSDQYGTKIQIVGRVGEDDDVQVVTGSVDDRRFVAVAVRDGHVRGAVGFGMPRQVMGLMARLGEGPFTVEEAVAVVSG